MLRSDHNPLVHLRQPKDPRGKFGQSIAELEEYNYTVEYIRGKDKNAFLNGVYSDCICINPVIANILQRLFLFHKL